MGESVFPKITNTLLDECVDMERATQDVWEEAPAYAVLLAQEVLYAPLASSQLFEMAKEIIWRYGNWREKRFNLPESVRQYCYRENYAPEWDPEYPWWLEYEQDGFGHVPGKEDDLV